MKKSILIWVVCYMLCLLTACGSEALAFPDAPTDIPAEIMVNNVLYRLELEPVAGEVDESAIIGYTTSYTTGTPANNGETNFFKELNLPYARVEDGILILYENEWYRCIVPAK